MLCTSGFVDDVMFSHSRPYSSLYSAVDILISVLFIGMVHVLEKQVDRQQLCISQILKNR